MRGVLVCVGVWAACGDNNTRHIDDARAVDAPADGTIGPQSGDITVTTLVRCCTVAAGTPQMGVMVVAVQPDGTVADHGLTDAQGTLVLHGVDAGAVVTVVYPEDAAFNTHVASMFAVTPGDSLTFGDAHFLGNTGGSDGIVTANVPAFAGAVSYYAYSPCAGGTASAPDTAIPISQLAACQTPTAPIVAVAYDDSFDLLASSYVAAADGTPGAIDDMGAWTANAQQNVTASITGLPPETVFVALEGEAVYPSHLFGASVGAPISAGTASAQMTLPITAPRTFGHARIERTGEFGDHHAYVAGAGTATMLPLTPPALPWVGGLVVNGTIGKAVWLQTAGSYDAAVLAIAWSHIDASETVHLYDWNVILPPGITALDFGAPPAELAPYMPGSADSTFAQLQLVDLASAADYDALRGVLDWQIEHPEDAVLQGDQASASNAQSFASPGGPALR
jgi:hypothetical protein